MPLEWILIGTAGAFGLALYLVAQAIEAWAALELLFDKFAELGRYAP